MFQQQLDVSRVWLMKNDGSTLAHSGIDQSTQNRAVFIVILGKTQFCSLLENQSASLGEALRVLGRTEGT